VVSRCLGEQPDAGDERQRQQRHDQADHQREHGRPAAEHGAAGTRARLRGQRQLEHRAAGPRASGGAAVAGLASAATA